MSSLREQRAKIINYVIVGVGMALIPISVLVILGASKDGWTIGATMQLAAFGVIWLFALNSKLARLQLRGAVIIGFLFLTALSEVYRVGMVTATFPILAVLPILGTVVGGMRVGLSSIGIVAIALIAVATLTITGERTPAIIMPDYVLNPSEWAVRIINVVIAAGIGVFTAGTLYRYHTGSIGALKKQNTELGKTQSRIAQSVKLAGLGYAITDMDAGKVCECDDRFAEMHGMNSQQFMSLDPRRDVIGRIVHEDDRDEARLNYERLLNGEALIAVFRHVMPDGQIKNIRKIYSPLNQDDPDDHRFEVVAQDVTQTRRLQDQLFQTQKLDAIGKLTGGIAHDFNNLLAVILGNLELLDEQTTKSEPKEFIRSAIDATLSGAELTRNMLAFARRAPLKPTTVDLNQIVRNMHKWTERTLPSTIDVETSLFAGLWPTKVDASTTESGFLNLVLNARDAMPGGGKLTIETSNVLIDESYLDAQLESIVPGRYVLLAVTDTGEGIPHENLKNIFVPFFTTKPVGSGSGLGLSMLEGFMKQSGGTVQVYTEPGVGTTFKLYFKATISDAIEAGDYASNSTEVTSKRNREKILLVEDNFEVLSAMRNALVRSGFRVVEATSGDEALRIFGEHSDVDLLLTDIVMPGELQGTMLAKSLRSTNPELPVVFMSGYASEATVHGNGLRPEDIRLMKPVRRSDLLRAVEKALAPAK